MLVMAWLIGEGIVTWRTAKHGAPPTPGSLAAVSGFFVLLAILAQYPPAKGAAVGIAVGVDIAAFLQVLPGSSGPVNKTRTWPPAKISDPTVFLPGGAGQSTAGNPANTPAAVGGANKQRGAPAGTPANPGIPPTGPGTIFPPGSQSL